MGHGYDVICNKCHRKFRVSEGGGFVFHLLHCNKCGKEKSIGFEELGEIHLRYLKGLPGPYCVATAEHDRHIKENYPSESLNEDEYNFEIEKMAGGCECTGEFKVDASARCTGCKSKSFTRDPNGCEIMYD